MAIIFWWLAIIWAIIITIVLVLRWRKRRKHTKNQIDKRLPVAHARAYTELPAYKTAMKRYKRLVYLGVTVVFIGLMGGVLLSSRLASTSIEQPQTHSRDIMLCLDVSGSMTDDDKEILKTFAKLAKGFKGERIGLSVFDSSSVSLFPLTDDYDFVVKQLGDASNWLGDYKSPQDRAMSSGISLGEGSSLIGDGLASCVMGFDNLGAKRSRTIILATDNYVSGQQIVTLKEAAALAKSKGIRTYGLNPADYSSKYYSDEVAKDFRDSVLITDGAYYKFSDKSAIPGLISQVEKQEATRFLGAPQLVQKDKPKVIIFIVMAGLMTLIYVTRRLEL
ncbi:MAG: hypothetical protein ABI354_02460 [Candidatus Saccharimonadales bacterium]